MSNNRLQGQWRRKPLKIELYGNLGDTHVLKANAHMYGLEAVRSNFEMGSNATIGHLFYEQAGSADGYVFTPSCPLFYIMGVLDETGTKNPLFCHYHKDAELLKAEHAARIEKMKEQGATDEEIKKANSVNWEDILRVRKPFLFFGEGQKWKDLKAIFTALGRYGMLRMKPDEDLHFTHDFAESLQFFKDNLKDSSRRHHVRQSRHMARDDNDVGTGTEPVEPRITVAYFGSASAKDPKFIKTGYEAAQLGAAKGWNAVHGGGSASVMQAVTDGVIEYNATHGTDIHVAGVSVFAKYVAPVFAGAGGEQDAQAKTKNKPHLFVESKDMATRMYEFGKRSHAFVVLPGGLGTVHEVLQVAHDRMHHLAHTSYIDAKGEKVDKPLILVNLKVDGKGIWDDLIHYLNTYEQDVADQITVVKDVKAAHREMDLFFKNHPPVLGDVQVDGESPQGIATGQVAALSERHRRAGGAVSGALR